MLCAREDTTFPIMILADPYDTGDSSALRYMDFNRSFLPMGGFVVERKVEHDVLSVIF